MGCDIHLIVQKRTAKGWQVQAGRWYDQRNYDLFGMLADVRNGHGVAGITTGDGFVPILGLVNPRRGLPDDLWNHEDYDLGEHSFSWLTVRELYEYDWGRETTIQRAVDAVQYDEWVAFGGKGRGEGPRSSSLGRSGGGWHFIEEHEMAQRIKEVVASVELPMNRLGARADAIRTLGNVQCWVHWRELYAERAGSFYTTTMPLLRRLADGDMHSDDVRIVFGFDS